MDTAFAFLGGLVVGVNFGLLIVSILVTGKDSGV